MSPIIASLAAAFAVMLISLAGVIFTSRALGAWMRAHLTYLTTFSAAVLSLLAYRLIEEALQEGPAAIMAAGSIVTGIIVLEVAHRLLPDVHHHHEPADHAHTAIDGRRLLISDAAHNITDGFIIVPAFLVDLTIGIAATLGILLHELVQEISEFFVLKEAGYSTHKALMLNFAASSTILFGVILAITLASFETTLALLAGFAGGGFLSVVGRDLLPHAIQSIRASGKWFPHLLAALIGVALMLGITNFVPHQEHEDELEDDARTSLDSIPENHQ